ncbi:MAG TPA: glycosyltransferase family 4 protein [Puia sp.]|nr:glycosyltransferase family 4 protein [Puia sp.]
MKQLISTYHHSFAGGSKNTSRLLHHLSKNGCVVQTYFFETPQYFTYTQSKVNVHTLGAENIPTEVVDSQAVRNYLLTERVINGIDQQTEAILFGANLFPYCNILLDAKSQLVQEGKSNPRLIIHPVGSDMWQIGTKLKPRVKWLLDNPLVDTILTYSDSFVEEIKAYYHIQKDIHVLPPVLEKDTFFPISAAEKQQRRKALGFSEEDFIIHHHSSMRKIKCPEIVLDIVIKAAQNIPAPCTLIMTGPVPHELINALHLGLQPLPGHPHFLHLTRAHNLTIYWTGILADVSYLMQLADMELNASIHDSFNLSLMEAMACGLPVVTSEIVGIAPHILKSGGGFCFPAKKLNFDELNQILDTNEAKHGIFDLDYAVDVIRTIADDRNNACSKGQAGAAYVAEEFGIEKAARIFHQFIS